MKPIYDNPGPIAIPFVRPEGSSARTPIRRVLRKPLQQSGDGRLLAGQDQAGGDLAQRLEHETAQVRAGMGQSQLGGGAHLAAEGDQVEVQGARLVQDLLWPAAEFPFQLLETGKEGFRGLARTGQETNDGVQERGRTWRTIHGGCLPDGRPQQGPIGELGQPLALPGAECAAIRPGSTPGPQTRGPGPRPSSFGLGISPHFKPRTCCMS